MGTALSMGCETAPERRVEITAHYVPACAPAATSAPAQLELVALGDFDRSNQTVSIVGSDASEQLLDLPPGTLAAELSSLGDRRYWGSGALNTSGQIPILMWPRDQACTLWRSPFAVESSERLLLGASRRLSTLLVLEPGAPLDASTAAVAAIDLDRASVTELPFDASARPLAFASVSELGDRLVVAGGVDPESGRATTRLHAFDPKLGRWATLGALAAPRARHAALSLPTGASLLIGGQDDEGQALESVEFLSADGDRASRVLSLLRSARISPVALHLDGSRILVGGGYVPDESAAAQRRPVSSVEFLSFDLSDVTDAPLPLEPAALDRDFVELSPGSALAVGGCKAAAADGPCLPCPEGCISREVWWIDARGAAYPLEPLPLELASGTPQLIAGANAKPWLLADGRLGRFDPWAGRFDVVDEPALGALERPSAVDQGSFVWLEVRDGALEVRGLHHSQRGAFSQDVAPLLAGTGEGLVPHRPPISAPDSGVVLRYRAASGLELAGSSAVASVADTHYADFAMELTLASGPAPLLKLTGISEAIDRGVAFGGLECPWPELEARAASREGARLGVRRQGNLVQLGLASSLSDPESAPAPCTAALPERVHLELVGTPLGTTQITRIEIRRSLE